MTDAPKTPIRALIDAVERDVDTAHHHASAFPSESAYGHCTWHDSHKASGGSLDAALALHEALLPGWCVCVDIYQRGRVAVFTLGDEGGYGDGRCTDTSGIARAWLLAILKAYEASQ